MSLRERVHDPEIFRVYGVTVTVSVAFGMVLSVIALFLRDRGIGKREIGELTSYFAAGIVLLSLPMGRLIERFGARVTLAAAFAGYVVAAAAFPFLETFESIAALRVLDGGCSVAVWVSCETILLRRAGPANKAFITSLYAITMAIGYVIGPGVSFVLAKLMPLYVTFLVAASIALVASIYTIAKVDRGPLLNDALGPQIVRHSEHHETPRPHSFASILWRMKTSCYATFAFGYFQASVVILLPIFMVEEKGISEDLAVLNPAWFGLGMLCFTNIGGRLGDRVGHLLMMRLLAAVGVGTVLAFVFLDRYAPMAAAVFVAGASIATISPLSLALQGVVIQRGEYPRANAIYNAFYGAGMLIGPLLSSVIFAGQGGRAMLYHLAAIWLGFVIFSLAFRRDDPRTQSWKSPPAEVGRGLDAA